MIYPMVLFPVTLSVPIDALDVLCAQLTRDLFAIAKFMFCKKIKNNFPINADKMIKNIQVAVLSYCYS